MFPREYRGVAGAVLLFLLIQLGSLALVQTFFEQGYQAVENPDDRQPLGGSVDGANPPHYSLRRST